MLITFQKLSVIIVAELRKLFIADNYLMYQIKLLIFMKNL